MERQQAKGDLPKTCRALFVVGLAIAIFCREEWIGIQPTAVQAECLVQLVPRDTVSKGGESSWFLRMGSDGDLYNELSHRVGTEGMRWSFQGDKTRRGRPHVVRVFLDAEIATTLSSLTTGLETIKRAVPPGQKLVLYVHLRNLDQ